MAQGRFTKFDVVLTLVSFTTLLLDVLSDLTVAVEFYVQLQLLWGSLVLGFLVVPLVVTASVSLKWHAVDGSLTWRTLLPHACLVAPFQRYLQVVSSGYKSITGGHPRDTDAALRKQNDASILRLFQTFLESAPQLLLQLSIMILQPSNIHPVQVWSAVCSLVSVAWALTVYCDSSRLSYQTPYLRRGLALTFHLGWHLFMITARVTALVLFTSVFYVWVCLFVGVHWVLMTVCTSIKGTDFGQGKWEKVLFHIASGFMYVFIFQNIHEGPSRGRMVPYYGLVFVENGALFAVWLIFGTPALGMKVAASVLVFGGFLLGALCLVVYYRWLHPSGPNLLWSVGDKLPASLAHRQASQLIKSKEKEHQGHPLAVSLPVPNESTVEVCIEGDATPHKGAGNAGDATFVVDSAVHEALVCAWQSGMESSDSSSTSSSLDAAECSLDEFNAAARSGNLGLTDKSQSGHSTSQSRRSSAAGRSHYAEISQCEHNTSRLSSAAGRSHYANKSQSELNTARLLSASERSRHSDQSQSEVNTSRLSSATGRSHVIVDMSQSELNTARLLSATERSRHTDQSQSEHSTFPSGLSVSASGRSHYAEKSESEHNIAQLSLSATGRSHYADKSQSELNTTRLLSATGRSLPSDQLQSEQSTSQLSMSAAGRSSHTDQSHSELNTAQLSASAMGQSHHADSSAEPQSPPKPSLCQDSFTVSGSVLPSDCSDTPDPASPGTQSDAEMEGVEEMEEADCSVEEGDRTVLLNTVRQSRRPRTQMSRERVSPDAEDIPPTQPLLQHHPPSTPTKPQDASSKIHLPRELSGSRKRSRNISDAATPLLGPPRPQSCLPTTLSSSDILPSRKRVGAMERLSKSFAVEDSPIESTDQVSIRTGRCGDASFMRASREAMAQYPDMVESLSPDPDQPKMFLGSDDMYGGGRAGGESMWGVSPDFSNHSSSQSRERVLSLAPSASRLPHLMECYDTGPDPACLSSQHAQGLPPTEEDKHEISLKDSSISESPDAGSPAVNNEDVEISWTSMNVNENEWSGLNNLKALTPDDSLCSFASNDREEETPQKSTGQAGRRPKNGADDEAFSRASTPSLVRSHSTSSLYHEFSSAGVSPSPPPGLRTGSRLSRHHSWVNSPFSSHSWQQPADTSWPLEYLSVDPAPPVEGEHDSAASRMDARVVVIEMLMDQLKRTRLRSGISPHFPSHSSSHLRSPSMQDERMASHLRSPLLQDERRAPHLRSPLLLDERVDPQALRLLLSEDPNATLSAPSEQGLAGRRSHRSDIDLMRQALDLIEMERFPHRFRQDTPDHDSPEIYVSGQYRPPIVDQGRESPSPHPQALTGSVGAGSYSRSRLNASLRQAPVPSGSIPQPPPGPQRSGHHPSVAHSGPRPGMEPQSESSRTREGLYRYFVHSKSPIHTPQWSTPQSTPPITPSQRHLLQQYLTQSHVERGLREERVQSAEMRSLRKPGARERLSSTLPAGGGSSSFQTEQASDHALNMLPAQHERLSTSLPRGVAPLVGRASDHHHPHNPHPGRTSSIHPHSTASRASGFVPHTLIPRATTQPADIRCFTDSLEVMTPDHPDSGMHSGTHSAASRRHPLQSLDNSPSLSPTSLTHQPNLTKPTTHTQGGGGISADRLKHSSYRSGFGQAAHLTARPESPRRSRSHSSQGHGHSTERSSDRNRQAPSGESQTSAQAKSVDCLR
ncbi:hypothetical protein ACOMHN_013468 [Nucella lapillus]